MKQLLIDLKACEEARKWAGNKTWQEIYTTCERGDWLLWLFKRTNPADIQLLTLIKGLQVNSFRDFISNGVILNVIDTILAFGNGQATIEQLEIARTEAWEVFINLRPSDPLSKHAIAAYYAANINVSHVYENVGYADFVRANLPIQIWNIDQ